MPRFYMLGAFFGFQISRWFGFWPALIMAPLLAGAIGAGVERFGLRHVHKNGHVAELLFTFGLAFAIEEIVQIIWGKSPVDYRVPPLLDFPAFTIFSTNYPAFKMFMLLVSIVIFVGLLVALKRTRIGLIVQAALTHPHMVGHLGHNVGRIFMMVFGVGTALAAVAGVIAGPALVTQSNMAGLLGPILFVVVVVGGLGSLPGAFVASLLIGLVQTFAVSMNGSLAGAFGPLSPAYAASLAVRHLERDHRADRADHALSAAGADPDLPADGPAWDPRHMSDLTASAAPPRPATAERLKFYGLWVAAALMLLLLPRMFSSGGSLTTFSLIGISIIFALSYNILLGQTGMLSFGHAVYYGLGGFLAIHAINIISCQQAADPAAAGAAGRRPDRTVLCRAARLGLDPALRHGVRDDLARRRRTGGVLGADPAHLLRRRSRRLRQPHQGAAPVRLELRAADPDLLSGRGVDPAAVIAMYALTRTPLGRMCNAVRDNPERVQFVGYDPHVVRYIAFCFSGFFAGIAGALAAINFEIANSAYLGAVQSGTVLFATYIGGVGFFIGPIVGAIFVTFLSLGLSDVTPVWQLYFGLIFIAVVMYRARRTHRPADDAPSADQGRHPDPGAAELSRSPWCRRWRWWPA